VVGVVGLGPGASGLSERVAVRPVGEHGDDPVGKRDVIADRHRDRRRRLQRRQIGDVADGGADGRYAAQRGFQGHQRACLVP
jgi:hypothetical protein